MMYIKDDLMLEEDQYMNFRSKEDSEDSIGIENTHVEWENPYTDREFK